MLGRLAIGARRRGRRESAPPRADPGIRGDPRVRFILTVGLYALGLLSLRGRDAWLADLLRPADLLTARAIEALLRLAEFPVERQGWVLAHPEGFSYQLYYPCAGLTMLGLLWLGLWALPGAMRAKVRAGAAGSFLLLAVNPFRLAALFWIGVRHPDHFYFFHEGVFQAIMLGMVVATWYVGLRAAVPLEGATATPGAAARKTAR